MIGLVRSCAGAAAGASTSGAASPSVLAACTRGEGPTASRCVASASRAGLSAMGVGIVTSGAATDGGAVLTFGVIDDESASREELLRRDVVSLSRSVWGVVGRAMLSSVDERRTAAPMREAHREPAGFGLPGGVGLLIAKCGYQREEGQNSR